jgi:hypothetical protein
VPRVNVYDGLLLFGVATLLTWDFASQRKALFDKKTAFGNIARKDQ